MSGYAYQFLHHTSVCQTIPAVTSRLVGHFLDIKSRCQNLVVAFMQLCALGISNSSSAWTLATQADDKAIFAENLGGQDLVVESLFAKSISTEKRE